MPDTVILTGPAVAKIGYWDLKSLQCKLGYDHLGTVKLIADPFNELVKELFYDSFGNSMSETEQRIYFPLGFAGGLRDIATGFVCFGFRDYDPSVGRFTTPDPALDVRGDGDIYDYCVDDPVNLVDEAGLQFSSASAAEAAQKGHKGISHPFGAKHGMQNSPHKQSKDKPARRSTNNVNNSSINISTVNVATNINASGDNKNKTGYTTEEKLKIERQRQLKDEYTIKTYVVGQRPLIFKVGQTKLFSKKFQNFPYNKGVYHEAFVSTQDGSNFGFGPMKDGTNFHSDDLNTLKQFRYDSIEYRADLIDEARKNMEKKYAKNKAYYDEMNKSLPGKDRIEYDPYFVVGENCQHSVDDIIKEAERLAQERGISLVVRNKRKK